MKYTNKERLVTGKKTYAGECSRYEAAEEYKIGEQPARD